MARTNFEHLRIYGLSELVADEIWNKASNCAANRKTQTAHRRVISKDQRPSARGQQYR